MNFMMGCTAQQRQQSSSSTRCSNQEIERSATMMMIDNINGGGEDGDVDRRTATGRGGGDGQIVVVEREHMFDKVVTPSDVGKLNRLVIPKQHAEKYFPLDSSTNDKGLLLNFEDRNGKPWRFRYSYWNSSQSYVMTKGWSRFVKEKKLDAGDIVSFQRGVGEFGRDRLFIDWRRRPDAPISSSSDHHGHLPGSSAASLSLPHQYFQRSSSNHHMHHPATATAAWNPWLLQQQQHHNQQPMAAQYYHHHPHPNYHRDQYSSHSLLLPHPHPLSHSQQPTNYMRSTGLHPVAPSGSVIYFRSSSAAAPYQPQQQQDEIVQAQGLSGSGFEPTVVFDSVPVVQKKAAASKRLRLFGVNMDCPDSSNSEDIIFESHNNSNTLSSHSSSSATTTIAHPSLHSYQYTNSYYDYNFTSTAMLPPPPPPPPPYSNSSSSSNIPYLQLSPYNATAATTLNPAHLINKGKSSMSFDLDI